MSKTGALSYIITISLYHICLFSVHTNSRSPTALPSRDRQALYIQIPILTLLQRDTGETVNFLTLLSPQNTLQLKQTFIVHRNDFQFILGAPQASHHKTTEIPMVYLNKGQFYPITLQGVDSTAGVSCSKVKVSSKRQKNVMLTCFLPGTHSIDY